MDEIIDLQDFCIKQCVDWINQGSYHKIGLEFNITKEYAPHVSKKLKELTGISLYIFEDTNRSCGECCIDEKTALPRGVEGIIHFGQACLTPTISLPVLYILPKANSFCTEQICSKILEENIPDDETLILVYDTRYGNAVGKLYEKLKDTLAAHIELSTMVVPENAQIIFPSSTTNGSQKKISEDLKSLSLVTEKETSNLFQFSSRQVTLSSQKDIKDCQFIYLGNDTASLNELQMKFSQQTFYCVDENGKKLSVSNGLKSVMSRSKKIEQIKEAKIIGILGTLIKGHAEIISRLKKLIKLSDKKCYTFFMGKINEPKLGNVDIVDVFVYVSCPQSSIFDRNENSYLYQKVVAPWEVEVALNPNFDWNLNFETNFQEFLKLEDPIDENNSSTIKDSLNNVLPCDTIALRPEGTLSAIHENGAGEALKNMSWQGLDPNLEASVPIGTVVEGKRGIASGYQTDLLLSNK